MRYRALVSMAAVILSASALFASPGDPTSTPMPAQTQMKMPMADPAQPKMPMPAQTQVTMPADSPAPGAMPPMDCGMMMQKMKDDEKMMDDRLNKLVDEMNKARGSAKADRTAAVVNELVSQRLQMREQMKTMMPKMMEHMMVHIQSGMMSGMARSIESCPMMKGDAPQSSAMDHKN